MLSYDALAAISATMTIALAIASIIAYRWYLEKESSTGRAEIAEKGLKKALYAENMATAARDEFRSANEVIKTELGITRAKCRSDHKSIEEFNVLITKHEALYAKYLDISQQNTLLAQKLRSERPFRDKFGRFKAKSRS